MTWLLRAFTGLKSAALWGLGVLAAIATAAYYRVRARRAEENLDEAERSLDTARQANANRDTIRRLPDRDIDERLRKYERGD